MTKRALIGLGSAALGRARLAQLGHILLDGARLDVHNSLGANGEGEVQEAALRHAPPGRIIVIDAGANVGRWTHMLAERAASLGRPEVEVHAFEPASETWSELEALAREEHRLRVKAWQIALSDAPGEARFFVHAPRAGSNSLYRFQREEDIPTETVPLSTVDIHCKKEGIREVVLLKTDCEGHDLAVLEGARGMLEKQAIGLVQFEYNARWIFGRHFLRDAFEFLHPFGYRVGKITPRGIEFYDRWHPELESFREGNYLASTGEWMARFPRVPWWNEGGRLGGPCP